MGEWMDGWGVMLVDLFGSGGIQWQEVTGLRCPGTARRPGKLEAQAQDGVPAIVQRWKSERFGMSPARAYVRVRWSEYIHICTWRGMYYTDVIRLGASPELAGVVGDGVQLCSLPSSALPTYLLLKQVLMFGTSMDAGVYS